MEKIYSIIVTATTFIFSGSCVANAAGKDAVNYTGKMLRTIQ